MRFARPQSPGVSPLDMLLGPRRPAEGHMNKVDSSSLASFTRPLYRLTTPAAREEQGTSLYLRYNIPPHAPRAGSAKEATSGIDVVKKVVIEAGYHFKKVGTPTLARPLERSTFREARSVGSNIF